MSYRSIKRVLGESSLERKIRVMFGICLLLLISGSFFWVNRITENLIRDSTQDKARELISSYMLKTHLENVQIGEERFVQNQEELFQALAQVVHSTRFRAESLVVDSTYVRNQSNPRNVLGTEEQAIVQQLIDEARSFQEKENRIHAFQTADKGPVTEQSYAELTEQLFDDRFQGNDYFFYTPIVFSNSCLECHDTFSLDPSENEAHSRAMAGRVAEQDEVEHDWLKKAPQYVLKITLPYREVKSGINKSRAILMAVAILTAFSSMVFLYLIVRYWIVKPLRHLRDVTEEVGHGRMDVRAELYTGDEFEQLARSLNRMLRHLLHSIRPPAAGGEGISSASAARASAAQEIASA